MLKSVRIRRYEAAVIAAALLVAEVELVVRRHPPLMPPQWQIRYYATHMDYKWTVVPDRELGFLVPPNQHLVIRTNDYTATVVTDSKGFPNRDPWPDHATVVFLGDSLLSGSGVPFEDSFTNRIARMMPDEGVVNLGVPGAGPEREFVVYRRFGTKLRPRFVVACLYLAADFDNDLQFTSWLGEGRATDYDTYRVNVPSSQGRWYTFPFERFLEQSWFYGMTKAAAHRWIQDSDDRYQSTNGMEMLLFRRTLEFARSPADASDPRITALVRSLEKLRDLVARDRAQLLVMLIPSKEELFGAPAAGRLNITARTRQRLLDENFPLLDLYPTLRWAAAFDAPYFRSDIHLTGYGNRIVAETFVHWFRHRVGGQLTHM